MGLAALTLVTPPLTLPSSPFCATIVQSAPSAGATSVLARSARHDDPWKLTASSRAYSTVPSQPPRQFSPFGPAAPAGPAGPVAPAGPGSPANPIGPCGPIGPTGPGGPAGPSDP